MPVVTILDPTATRSDNTALLANRPSSLDGLRIGLLHNSKPGGEVLLQTIADRLALDYQLKDVVWQRKRTPSEPAPFLDQMARECDAVILALAD